MSRYMDTLGDLSDEESDGSEGSDSPTAKKKKTVAQPAVPDPETLMNELGFATPSVLFVPEPASTGAENWDWGKGAKQEGDQGEGYHDREETRRAATSAVEEAAALAQKAQAHAAKLREEAKEEHMRIARERRLTFQQKEKRKRDVGQAKSAKNYVEEEKRVARNFGMYSGFD